MTDREKALLTYHLLGGERMYLPCRDEGHYRVECSEYLEWVSGLMPDKVAGASMGVGTHEVRLVGGGLVLFVSDVWRVSGLGGMVDASKHFQ